MTPATVITDPDTGEATLSWIAGDERGREARDHGNRKTRLLPRHPRDAHALSKEGWMTRRKIKPGAIETDVDLDAEVVYLADAGRLTEQVAEELAQRALARHRGRPSVTGENARTPSLTVRVPPETRTALEELARAQGKRLADVSREALDEYVSRHAS
jgi:hypothetical protein